MPPLSDSIWLKKIAMMDHAFQPIANIHTGECYGYEALLRNVETADFTSIDSVFDTACHQGMLHQVEMSLREKAIRKFMDIPWHQNMMLFLNLDNRCLNSEDYEHGLTMALIDKLGISRDFICFELSEKQKIAPMKYIEETLENCKTQQYKIAIDDYGAGFAGPQMLYHTDPDYIKIDRFFISGITTDQKKKMFVSSIVDLAHIMGAQVIAEGVETEKELAFCRDIGCDLVQGYHVARPTRELSNLKETYSHIKRNSKYGMRSHDNRDKDLILSEMVYIPPITSECALHDVFTRFRECGMQPFFPVVNRNMKPVGMIHDTNLKNYVYTPYGFDLLKNPAFEKKIGDFIVKSPIADLTAPLEKILAKYTGNDSVDGIIIVDQMKYLGYLSAKSLLKIINEKNLKIAREQNPLTHLPGNTMIHEYILNALEDSSCHYSLVYVDIDNFKVYNDSYGFRNGDRILLMLSDLLKTYNTRPNWFIGHIGGDDFFLGIKNGNPGDILNNIQSIARKFQENAADFYDKETREKGHVMAKNREGKMQRFELLTASSAIINLPVERKLKYSPEKISHTIGKLKKKSKQMGSKIAEKTIL